GQAAAVFAGARREWTEWRRLFLDSAADIDQSHHGLILSCGPGRPRCGRASPATADAAAGAGDLSGIDAVVGGAGRHRELAARPVHRPHTSVDESNRGCGDWFVRDRKSVV